MIILNYNLLLLTYAYYGDSMNNLFKDMDETDRIAIKLLVKAPLMSKEEMNSTISYLKKIAREKDRNKKVNEVLDYWANKAYLISMKS
ncbi:MAG: hypothetical protein PWP15_169 [Methanothermococcus sp.]|nr:hypothetical protein [Methanothermococcus sp.]MDK2987381.1 hypothetical protein [Methanothermococcus sp.]